MIGLDSRYLKAHDLDPARIAGLIPFSGHTITHFTIREERGIPWQRVVVDEFAPIHHLGRNAPPILLITGEALVDQRGARVTGGERGRAIFPAECWSLILTGRG